MSTTALAQKVGISRTTLHGVESGQSSVSMGMYLRVLCDLGLAGQFASLGLNASQQKIRRTQEEEAIRADGPKDEAPRANVVKVETGNHVVQDFQSLLMHEEAVRLLKRSPELILVAHEILARWRANGQSRSSLLWQDWTQILNARNWRKALANTQRGQQLRQASPLPTLLPEATRLRILGEIGDLKRGVELTGAP